MGSPSLALRGDAGSSEPAIVLGEPFFDQVNPAVELRISQKVQSWAMYEHIARRISGSMVSDMIEELFGLITPSTNLETARIRKPHVFWPRSCKSALYFMLRVILFTQEK